MIRKININDFEQIEEIGNNNYVSNYYESAESFLSKIINYPDGCFVAEINDKVCGYIVSFPYLRNEYYPINQIYSVISNPNCYYIHDLCVSPEYRNDKVASALLSSLNHGYKETALVAVMNSGDFWRRKGFKTEKNIDYYGLMAEYMVKNAK